MAAWSDEANWPHPFLPAENQSLSDPRAGQQGLTEKADAGPR